MDATRGNTLDVPACKPRQGGQDQWLRDCLWSVKTLNSCWDALTSYILFATNKLRTQSTKQQCTYNSITNAKSNCSLVFHFTPPAILIRKTVDLRLLATLQNLQFMWWSFGPMKLKHMSTFVTYIEWQNNSIGQIIVMCSAKSQCIASNRKSTVSLTCHLHRLACHSITSHLAHQQMWPFPSVSAPPHVLHWTPLPVWSP